MIPKIVVVGGTAAMFLAYYIAGFEYGVMLALALIYASVSSLAMSPN